MVYSKLTNKTSYEWQKTGHFGGINRKPIDMIVLHHNASSASNIVPNVWIDREASAHYQIENGTIINCLDEGITAWHCGASGYDNNSHTIGIEHQNSTLAPNWLVSDENQEKSALLVADIAQRYNIPIDRKHIVRHREMPGTATSCSGGLNIDWIVNRANEIVGNDNKQQNNISEDVEMVLLKVIDKNSKMYGTVWNFNGETMMQLDGTTAAHQASYLKTVDINQAQMSHYKDNGVKTIGSFSY